MLRICGVVILLRRRYGCVCVCVSMVFNLNSLANQLGIKVAIEMTQAMPFLFRSWLKISFVCFIYSYDAFTFTVIYLIQAQLFITVLHFERQQMDYFIQNPRWDFLLRRIRWHKFPREMEHIHTRAVGSFRNNFRTHVIVFVFVCILYFIW